MRTRSVLLVSNYYPPEKGAAPNRIQLMAKALSERGCRVSVVCPFPNYPTGKVFQSFKGGVYKKANEDEVVIHRLWIWPSNSSNKFIRLCSMLSFAFSLSLFFIFKSTPKIIFVQLSPIFVGFCAIFWSWIFQKKIILNVSDLWPLAGLEMGILKKGFYYDLLERIERFCYKKAHLILGQSEEILSHIRSNTDVPELFLYRNYPNFHPPLITDSKKTPPVKIVYAGLLGVAQGLVALLNNIDIPEQIEIHIYGNGPEAKKISKSTDRSIIYHGELSRDKLHAALQEYDIALIPLANRIFGSVPSKIFEYSRLGLPLLYMGGGEGEDLVNIHQLGWVIPVGNYTELQNFLQAVAENRENIFLKSDVQKRAIKAFNFDKQFDEFVVKMQLL